MQITIGNVEGADWDLRDEDDATDFAELLEAQRSGKPCELIAIAVDMGEAEASYYEVQLPSGHIVESASALYLLGDLEKFYQENKE